MYVSTHVSCNRTEWHQPTSYKRRYTPISLKQHHLDTHRPPHAELPRALHVSSVSLSIMGCGNSSRTGNGGNSSPCPYFPGLQPMISLGGNVSPSSVSVPASLPSIPSLPSFHPLPLPSSPFSPPRPQLPRSARLARIRPFGHLDALHREIQYRGTTQRPAPIPHPHARLNFPIPPAGPSSSQCPPGTEPSASVPGYQAYAGGGPRA